MGVHYGPADQEEQVDEAFYGQLEMALQPQALVALGDLNHTDACWRDNMAQHRQPRKFLQVAEDNFVIQVVEEPKRTGVLLDFVLPSRKDWVNM